MVGTGTYAGDLCASCGLLPFMLPLHHIPVYTVNQLSPTYRYVGESLLTHE